MEFSVSCKCENGELTTYINDVDANKYTMYAYYLCDNSNNILVKQGYINKNKFSFKIKSTGMYYVRGFIKYKDDKTGEYIKKSKKSKKINCTIIEPETIKEDDNFDIYNTKPSVNKQRLTEDIHKIYQSKGYYFYRSNFDNIPCNDTWKVLKSGYQSINTKYYDDCSFMMCSKGFDVFINYPENKPIYAYNTVIVDEDTYICIGKTDDLAIKDYKFFEGYDYVRAINNSYNTVKFTRDFYSADDLTFIVDTLQSNITHKYSQVFNLSENMYIISYNNNEIVAKLADTEYIVRLKQWGNPVKLSIIHNKNNAKTLVFNATAEEHIFITTITIENKDGLVRIGNEYRESSLLEYNSECKILEL